MDKKEIQSFLGKYHLKPIKKFGQNFLINQGAILDIVKKVKNLPPPFVEVGPGLGALTRHFSNRKKNILLIEKDKKLAKYWKEQNYSVFVGDALRLNWEDLPQSFTLFGNLPYEIAGRLILQASLHQNQVCYMLFLMQKEVAQRVTAPCQSSNYGLLSVMSQELWDVSSFLNISSSYFYPRPKVDGRVLFFTRKKRKDHLPVDLFLKFVKKTFSFKRKMIFKQMGLKDFEKAKAKLKKLGISPTSRAEELSPHQFVQLYFEIQKSR